MRATARREDFMKLRTCMFAVAIAGTTVAPAFAGTSVASSESPAPSLALTLPQVASELAAIVPLGHVNTTYQSIRYRPRWRRERSYSEGPSSSPLGGYLQLHGGFFDPKGDVSNGAMFGM